MNGSRQVVLAQSVIVIVLPAPHYFSDKSIFYESGEAKKHDLRIEAPDNPHQTHLISRYNENVTILGGFLVKKLWAPSTLLT